MVGIPPILSGLNWSGWNTNHVVGNPTCAHGEEILIVAAFSNFTKICILKRSIYFMPIEAGIQRRSKWNWPQKSNKKNVFCGSGWFSNHQNNEKYTNLGKTTPKLEGITLEQAEMYGQYGIESVGLKKDWKTAHKKSCHLKLKYGVWWSGVLERKRKFSLDVLPYHLVGYCVIK